MYYNLNMIQRVFAAAAILVLASCQGCTRNAAVSSPDNRIKLELKAASGRDWSPASIAVTVGGRILADDLTLGLTTDLRDFSDSLRISAVSAQRVVKDDYTMLTGKRSHCTNTGHERVFTLENPMRQRLNVICRVYDDGVAFRYSLPDIGRGEEHFLAELTSFNIPDGTKRWIQEYEMGYERFYPLTTDGGKERNPSGKWNYPVLYQVVDSLFALITEADIRRDQCASFLVNSECGSSYVVTPDGKDFVLPASPLSPWRVMIAGTLADIVESTLVTDVSPESTVEDTGWIHPASASWVYWAYNHGSKVYPIVRQYIDLAAEMGWPYVLIDWEWSEMTGGGDIDDALAYAHEKGVKPLLWYNSSLNWVGPGSPTPLYRFNTPEAREQELDWLEQKGVAGVKVDFFRGDNIASMNYSIDLLEAAAKHKIAVTFHGATIPRGWQRTYPNLMTIEAVYGAEWYNNGPALTDKAAAHNCTLPFTRNVVGPMDYTPGTFSDSQYPHITTYGHELALLTVFESAVQHMPDTPETYRALPAEVREFLSGLPTAWDETRLLDGYPADRVVMARCKGDRWYVAGLNGTDSPRSLNADLAKLGLEGKKVTLFADGEAPRSFSIRQMEAPAILAVECLPMGGFSALIQ